MKITIAAILLVAVLAHQPAQNLNFSPVKFINGTGQFIEGFAEETFGSPAKDVVQCTNKAIDFTVTLEEKVLEIFGDGDFGKFAAIADLFWHAYDDLPYLIKDCNIVNSTKEILVILEDVIDDFKDFSNVIAAVRKNLASAIVEFNFAVDNLLKEQWFKAGQGFGKIAKSIIDFEPTPKPEPKPEPTPKSY